jgi:hypothetical protein
MQAQTAENAKGDRRIMTENEIGDVIVDSAYLKLGKILIFNYIYMMFPASSASPAVRACACGESLSR